VAEIGHTPENRLGELLADHRRSLEQPLLPLGQAVNSCCEDALHGRGQADLFRGLDEAIRTSRSGPSARLDQRLDNFLHEEGIAARALLDGFAESLERRITAEEVGE